MTITSLHQGGTYRFSGMRKTFLLHTGVRFLKDQMIKELHFKRHAHV